MSSNLWDRIRPVDEEAIRACYERSEPFPYFCIDDFLQPEFALAVSESYPGYEAATSMGRAFSALSEHGKVQICDRAEFADPVAQLDDALRHPEFLGLLERVTGIPKLLADDELVGGGMHLMSSGGRLDVHVDFNLIEDRALHRRLNILLFFNEGWQAEWGGRLEFWDSAVRDRGSEYLPSFNRCVVFETSERSFHGVTPLSCPQESVRKSFAAYYYTREAPEEWDGRRHTTVFRARPEERFRRGVLMPAEFLLRPVRRTLLKLKRRVLGEGPR